MANSRDLFPRTCLKRKNGRNASGFQNLDLECHSRECGNPEDDRSLSSKKNWNFQNTTIHMDHALIHSRRKSGWNGHRKRMLARAKLA